MMNQQTENKLISLQKIEKCHIITVDANKSSRLIKFFFHAVLISIYIISFAVN